MHHIPTRTEMDEMQKVVTELKRELRAMRRSPESTATKATQLKAARKRGK
jgi:hypothetical protein